MPYALRSYNRVPVCCPVTYQTGDFEGRGMVWNCSMTGWRFSGTLPLREGEFFSMTVTLPSEWRVYIVTATVCWVRGEDYGAETITMDEESREVLEKYLDLQLDDWMESHW
jgi:hypothetical protein